MRAYYVPMAAGAALAASAFFPRVRLGGLAVGGWPATSAVWTLILGAVAVLLASLSVVTRKNSRHPLLLVGLLALGVELLDWRMGQRAAEDQAWVTEQARAIVSGMSAVEPSVSSTAFGFYLGIVAALVITLFGLTIVVRQASQPYAVPENDDL